MAEQDYLVRTSIEFKLNKFWKDDDPNLEQTLDNLHNSFEEHAVETICGDSDLLSHINSKEDIGVEFDADGDGWIAYDFLCADESASEAESFAEFCAMGIKEKLEAFGAHIVNFITVAEVDTLW